MADQLRSDTTILVLQLGANEFAIDVNEDFKDVHVYFRKDGGKIVSFLSPFGESYSDDVSKAQAIAAALVAIAEFTEKELRNV